MHDRLSPAAANRRGIIAMAAAMASSSSPTTPWSRSSANRCRRAQLIFLRGVFATLLLMLAVCAGHGRAAARARWRPARAATAGPQAHPCCAPPWTPSATIAYLTSLFHLPIGNATAINMATPLFITLFAVLAFKEQVGTARWLAIGVGFAGVLLIVQPAAGGLQRLGAAVRWVARLLHAGRDLVTRIIPIEPAHPC
jgi:drug/metabolite transporter (DMT)-like permease